MHGPAATKAERRDRPRVRPRAMMSEALRLGILPSAAPTAGTRGRCHRRLLRPTFAAPPSPAPPCGSSTSTHGVRLCSGSLQRHTRLASSLAGVTDDACTGSLEIDRHLHLECSEGDERRARCRTRSLPSRSRTGAEQSLVLRAALFCRDGYVADLESPEVEHLDRPGAVGWHSTMSPRETTEPRPHIFTTRSAATVGWALQLGFCETRSARSSVTPLGQVPPRRGE